MVALLHPLARLLLVVGALLAAPAVRAADLTVVVTDANGRPVADAVVVVDGSGDTPAAGNYVITQHNMAFVPHVMVIPVGSTIEFGNLDPFRHHVYSFSAARKFELRLFGQGETRPVRFDTPGLVAIGCNIHDSMRAFIHVVDTPFARKTDASGRVTIRGLPSGSQRVRVWHENLRAPGNQLAVTATAGATTLPVTLRLRRPAPAHHAY